MADIQWDVIVIGAGIAGLSSAYRIIKRSPKIRVLVLEANDRVGGRTLSKEVNYKNMSSGLDDSDILDMGAHWICTTQHEIMDLAHELGIRYFRQNVQGRKIMMVGNSPIRTYNSEIPSVGSYLSPHTWIGLAQLHLGINKIEAMAKTINVRNPYLHPMAHVYDSETAASFIRSIVGYAEVYDILNTAFIAAFGCDLSQISFLNFLTIGRSSGGIMKLFVVEDCGAEEFRVIGGTQQFSNILADRIKSNLFKINKTTDCHNDILLGHTVKSIVQDRHDEERIEVTCENGEQFVSRYLVLAVPPNIIARLKLEPPLPTPQQHLYENMKMGNLAKVFIIYKTPFWLKNGFSGEYVGKTSLTSLDERGGGPICVMYDATTEGGLPAIVGFVGGEALDKWWHQDKEIFEKAIVHQMVNCFGHEAEHPENIIYKNWIEEPNIRGGPVSILSPGNMRFFNYLRRPHLNIHFAGTNLTYTWMGYLSGAVQSGYTSAAEILEKFEPHSLTEKDKEYLSDNDSVYSENVNHETGFSYCNFSNHFVPSSIAIGIGIGILISRYHKAKL